MAAGSFDVAPQTPIQDLIIIDEEDDNGMHRKSKFEVVENKTYIPKACFYRPARPVRRIAPKQPVDIKDASVQSNATTKRRKHNPVKQESKIFNVPILSNVVNQPINYQTLPINQVVLNNGAAAPMMSFSQPMQTYEFQNGSSASVQPQTINLNGLQVVQQQQQQQQQPQRAPLVLRMINNAGQEQTVLVQNGNAGVIQNTSNNGIVFVNSPVDDFNKSQQQLLSTSINNTSGFGNYVLNPVNQNMMTSNVQMTNLMLNNGQIMQQNNASQPQIIVVNNIQAMSGGGSWSDAPPNYQILTQLPNVNNDVNFMMMQDVRNSPSVLNFPQQQQQQINNVQSQPVYVHQIQPTQEQPQQIHVPLTANHVKLLQNVDASQTVSKQVDTKPKVQNETVDWKDVSSGNVIAGARPKRKVREKKLSVVIELSDSEEEKEEVQEFKQEEECADLMWDSMVIIENDIQCS